MKLSWNRTHSKNNILLQELGSEGKTIVVIPGLEGSGESCRDLLEWMYTERQTRGIATKIILVDYKNEEHKEFNELVASINSLLLEKVHGEVLLWSQSFGNLIAASLASMGNLKISRHALLSPFTGISLALTMMAVSFLKLAPRGLYKSLSNLFGSFLFGPVGMLRNHDFFSIISEENPSYYQRRLSWLRELDGEELFRGLSAPVSIWIGLKDRLISPKYQLTVFQSLQFQLNELQEVGHMLFPSILKDHEKEGFLAWIDQNIAL